jgi:hypothetical protein
LNRFVLDTSRTNRVPPRFWTVEFGNALLMGERRKRITHGRLGCVRLVAPVGRLTIGPQDAILPHKGTLQNVAAEVLILHDVG